MNATRTTPSNALGRRRRWLAALLLGLALLASQAAEAQVAFRSAASGSALAPGFVAASSAGTTTFGTISFPVAAGNQVAVGANSSFSVAIPTGIQDGDFAVFIIAGRPIDTSDPAAPAGGWIGPRSSSLVELGTNDLKILTFYRFLVSGDSGGIVTVSLPAGWNGTGRGMSGQIAVWRGVDPTTPFDTVADVTATNGAFVDWRPPSITTVTNGAWVVSAMATSDDNALGISTANGFTGRMTGGSYDTLAGGDHSVGLADRPQATAGAPTMLTWSETLNAGTGAWVSITFALRPAGFTINKPAGTVQNDVMVASIGFRLNSPGQYSTDIAVAAPAGWTLVRRLDNLNSTGSGLAVYRLVAGASEPASYSWTLSCINASGGDTCNVLGFNGAAGGIVSFSGVNTTTPIGPGEEVGVSAAVAAADLDTLSITTAVANSMLVTSHDMPNANTWADPPTSGMKQAFQVTAGSEMVQVSYAQAPAAATGTKRATDLGPDTVDMGNAHILALRPATPPLTINKPAGTVANDVMIAAIAVQPNTATITAPSGWTLVRRTDQASGTTNSLAVYRLTAGASEPASYTWSISNFSYAVGGIQSFSGVDTTAPVNVENGAATPSALTHATPDVTPTVANTMLVTAHTFASSATWTPPTGMTEAYDTANLSVPNARGQSIEGSYAPHVFLATGVRTATASGDADTGNAHILALRPLSATGVAGGYNAYDTGTAAGATSGFVKTKIAGSTVSVAIIALNLPRTAIQTDFAGTVKVEVLDASNSSGALDAYGCRSTWTVLQTLSPDPVFIAGDLGRKTVSFTQANSYPDLRIRVSYPTASPTRIGCSNDNFALRPNTFASFAVTDTDWQTTGAPGARALNLLTFAATTPLHKAGRPFSVRATAQNAAGTPATTTNYVGAPTATLTACVGAACTATFGTLTLTTTFVAGQLSSDVASYNNVGSFALQLVDSTFSNADAADGSTTTERNITSSTINVGRFVPDNFAVALNTPTFGTTCGSFTYIGEKFNYTTAPVITVTARNFAGGTTTLYNTIGSWWRITNTSVTGKSYTAAAGALDTSGITGTDPDILSTGSGTGTLTFRTPSFFVPGTGFFFTRTTPVAPFDADISLAINVIDADGVTLATNPARFGTATAGNGIAFNSGKPMRFGQLVIRNAIGSQFLPLPVRVEAQYWSGSAFITNTLDNCTTIATANNAMGTYTGNLSSCETALSGGGALSMGRRTLQLAAPGGANNGSVILAVNLGASASGNTCTAVGAGPGAATTTANLPHLQGNWTGANYDQNPTARATFGISGGANEVIYVRENY